MTGPDYMGEVARLPCICCLCRPVHVHHCIMGRFSQARASDFDTVPLCDDHHQLGRFGAIALHAEPAAWQAEYGLDTDHIMPTRRMVLGPAFRDFAVVGGQLVRVQ